VTLPAAYEFLQVPLGPKNEALQKEKLFVEYCCSKWYTIGKNNI
jgi:hypothetical protein